MTNAELAILSLVVEQPRHGYEIEQVIETRGMRQWTEIGFSSIYYLLNKLEQEGLIESQLQQLGGKGPARKVFSITQRGREAVIDGALAALAGPQSGSVPFVLGLSNYPHLPRERVLAALNSYANLLEERLNHILERAEEQRPLPNFVEAMFGYSRVLTQAELDWVRNFTREVEAGRV